jgi:hypothetical protein
LAHPDAVRQVVRLSGVAYDPAVVAALETCGDEVERIFDATPDRPGDEVVDLGDETPG